MIVFNFVNNINVTIMKSFYSLLKLVGLGYISLVYWLLFVPFHSIWNLQHLIIRLITES